MEKERIESYPEKLTDAQQSFFAKIGKKVVEMTDPVAEREKELTVLREHVISFVSNRNEVEARILEGHEDGGTFDFEGNEVTDLEGTETLQVSFCRPEIWSSLTPEQIARLTCDIVEAYSLSPNQVYLGIYGDSEISFNFPGEQESDVDEIAAMFNQESVFDWRYKQGGEVLDWDKACKPNPFYNEYATLDYEMVLQKIGGENDE